MKSIITKTSVFLTSLLATTYAFAGSCCETGAICCAMAMPCC
ncbi:hypothetical protein [Limnobacter parvus]|uniref:Uncharacterized protein n=1 Tax=Limnobacter parvus TaxID=2939690 RepID=A0ABT1XJ44_9BURK|nr:hypothetical protein [Limnobacter parvus]MCR2747292.1 hypothetical protein [Limnobacter parvus]